MASKRCQLGAGTGTTARPGADTSDRAPRRALDPPIPVRTAIAAGSRWRLGVAVVTAAAAAVTVFSSAVLYADLGNDRATEVAVAEQPPAPLAATRSAPPAPTTAVVQAPVNAPATKRRGNARTAPPVRLSISQLGIDQRLIGLQVKPDRQLEAPKVHDDIGWWTTGPAPGERGAAVMVGHVDSMEGPAVFYRLASLRKGATISVQRADKSMVTFVVSKVQSYPKDHFPDQLVYRTDGRPALHLMTCSGVYDTSTGYRDNVVVFADLVMS